MNPLPPSNDIQPLPTEKNWFLRHLIVSEFIGLAIIVLGVTGYYYYQATHPKLTVPVPVHHAQTDATANWKTYTNSQYGFEFKYPSNLKVDECDPSFIYLNGNCDSDAPYSGLIQIEDPKSITIDKNAEFKTINLGGIQAKQYSGQVSSVGPGPEDGANSEGIFFSKDNKTWHLEFIADTSGNFPGMDQILSTFKFTEKDPLSSIKVGDKFGDMTVQSIKTSEQSLPLSLGNAEIVFTGQTRLVGTYERYTDSFYGDAVCFTVNSEVTPLPLYKETQKRGFFCFDDTADADKQLITDKIKKGSASIIIDEYKATFCDSCDAYDNAHLVKIIETN
jgi:hypothetical protein